MIDFADQGLEEVIFDIAVKIGAEPDLAIAVFQASENVQFNDREGLIPVRLDTARNLGYDSEDLLSAGKSLECGCRYLKILWEHFEGVPTEEDQAKFVFAAFYANVRYVRRAMQLAESKHGGDAWLQWKTVEPFFYDKRCYIRNHDRKIFFDGNELVTFVNIAFEKYTELKKESVHEKE